MAIYLCKEGLPEHYSSNFTMELMGKLTRLAYQKSESMTSAISKLKNQLYSSQIGICEYIIAYRLCRNKYMKPDPNW